VLARVAGDLGLPAIAPAWSAAVNVVAIALFVVNTFRAVRPGAGA
jgi:hypothetical protein